MKYKFILLLTLIGILGFTACNKYPTKVEFSVGFADLVRPDKANLQEVYIRFVTPNRSQYYARVNKVTVSCTGFVHGDPEVTGTLVNEEFLQSAVIDVKDRDELEKWQNAINERDSDNYTLIYIGKLDPPK